MSQELRDLIKQAPVSQIIAHFIPVQKKGAQLVSLCPFHADTKPSLTINDQRGLFRCFACNTGGDAITFVELYRKVDFKEALKECAQILGLPWEDYFKAAKKNPRQELAFRVLDYATKVYKKATTHAPPEFKTFCQERKIAPEMIQKFELGFAPAQSLLAQSLSELPENDRLSALKMAQEIDLIRASKIENTLPFYDFYRSRIVFPIHDHAGQVRGFSCRKTKAEQEPKFLNSRDSFVFHKSSILFGFFLAKHAIRQNNRVFIAEGNMDVIMMHQAGFAETVGTMGTAFGEAHAKMLTHMTTNIYLIMDSDPAGLKAMRSIQNVFFKLGFLPRWIDFSPHKDPDEFIREAGHLAFQERLEAAPILIDSLIEQILGQKTPETIEGKLQLLNQIFELLAPLGGHLLAMERVYHAAKVLGLKSQAEALSHQYQDYLQKNFKPPKLFPALESKMREDKQEDNSQLIQNSQDEAKSPKLLSNMNPEKVQSPLTTLGPYPKTEGQFLKTLLDHPECINHPQLYEILAHCTHPEVKQCVSWIQSVYPEIDEREYESVLSMEAFTDRWSGQLKALVAEVIQLRNATVWDQKTRDRWMKDLKTKIVFDQLKDKRKQLVAQQLNAETDLQAQEYMLQVTQIDKELQNLMK
jgi:DNA primase